MGLVKIIAAMPIHIKAIFVACIGLVGAWMLITPVYLEILSWGDGLPVWGWMIIGVGLIVFAAKFGKAIL